MDTLNRSILTYHHPYVSLSGLFSLSLSDGHLSVSPPALSLVPLTTFDCTRSHTPKPDPLHFRRPPLTHVGRCRQSIGPTRSKIHSTSFFHFAHTPQSPTHPIPTTPLPADSNFDLTAFGYISIIVDVSGSTPTTPEIYEPLVSAIHSHHLFNHTSLTIF